MEELATSSVDLRCTPPAARAAERIFGGQDEMSTRCRSFDWAHTRLGPVEQWSQSLRTTVALVLASRNPMFIWWGPDLIQIYNDAYRPSLGGDGRHPRALGASGREFWNDIWETIGPQIEQVMSGGEAVWHEDQYLPIDRNGKREDVWWTYSYSAVLDDDGTIGGTLVVCQETTSRILAEREREQLIADTNRAEHRAARLLEQVKDHYLTMDSAFTITDVNPAALQALGKSRDELCGRSHWDVFPSAIGTEVERQYRRVIDERVDVHLAHHYVGEGYDVYLEIDAYPTEDGGIALFWRDMTERRIAELELRETASRLQAIYDGTSQYIGLLTVDGTLLEANLASLEFARNRREDVVGKPFCEGPWFAHTPGAVDAIRAAITRAGQGEVVRFEADLRRPDGRWATFDISLTPMLNDQGEVTRIVPEGHDITKRREAERALEESEFRYRTLFESIDEGFCVLELIFDEQDRPIDYRYVETNSAFLSQTGLVDAIGRTIREMVPDIEQHWIEAYGKVATTGEPIRFESASAAMQRWFDVYAFRLGSASDRRVAVLFKDVTLARAARAERDLLLHALEIEQARLSYVFQQAPAFLAVLRGPEHVFELVNDAYYQLVGHRELLGRPVFEALPETRSQGFRELLDDVLRTGNPFLGRELPLTVARTPNADPEERFVDLSYLPMTEADGTRSGIIAHGTDVTEQVLARREVERLLGESEVARADAEAARAEAESAWHRANEANRAKSEFLAVMSHELRTPLNAIGGYVELIEMGIRGPVTPQQREDLGRIQKSQRHLLGLINEVLNYAKLESGTVHYDIADAPVWESLQAAEALVAPQARARGLTFVVGSCPRDLEVRADAEKLRQILVNLLSNAVKFTGRGGQVALSCTATATSVHFEVSDTGIGIPAERLPTIFDPFVQVRADLTRPHEGTGLGLAISRDLACGMGGDIQVESTEGKGSRFTLSLPRT
jgi:PAS domain S-box-containing protein